VASLGPVGVVVIAGRFCFNLLYTRTGEAEVHDTKPFVDELKVVKKVRSVALAGSFWIDTAHPQTAQKRPSQIEGHTAPIHVCTSLCPQ
jgi:hypothetical protein